MDSETTTEYSVFETVLPHKEYATTGQRLANFIIDMIVAYAITFAVFFMLGMFSPSFAAIFSDDGIGIKLLDRLLTALILALVFTVIEGLSKGKTLGKLITGTRAVQDDTYEPITWNQALTRSFSRIVPFEAFSGFGGHPWHDKWSKTVVIKDR